jgi:hypothetical protein
VPVFLWFINPAWEPEKLIEIAGRFAAGRHSFAEQRNEKKPVRLIFPVYHNDLPGFGYLSA